MGRSFSTPPRYCRQKKPLGRDIAFVEVGGHRHYLGDYGTPESQEAYHRLLAEVAASGSVQAPAPQHEITVVEVAERYLTFARKYYVKHGKETAETANIALALRPLTKLYGRTKAAEFGPRALKAVRQEMIDDGGTRKYINRHVSRLKRIFKWAVAEEIVPSGIYYGLLAVSGLKLGRSEAPDAPLVKPVSLDLVTPVKKVVSPQVRAMIDLQQLTGARSGEIVIMRGIDIDTSGLIWTYKPERHKTEHHGYERVIPLGPKARAIVEKYLQDRPLHAYLFAPLEAEAGRYAKMQISAEKPFAEGFGNSGRRLRESTRRLGDHYDRTSYARAIARGCEVAFPPPEPLGRRRIHCQGGFRWEKKEEWMERLGKDGWEQLRKWRREHHWHPHQLRHNFATDVRKVHGLEVTQILLGHAKADVTQIYAERDLARAKKIARKIG